MPVIVPPSRNQLGEVIAELEALGGTAKQDFRIARTRTNVAVLDVSEGLYAKWSSGRATRVGLTAESLNPRELGSEEPAAAAPDPSTEDGPGNTGSKTTGKGRK